ncbi:MAG: hypothetical protein NZ742_04840 [Acidobacteria bacterium]|nr:hypothetical protein [Acidobacteriota bacterium]MDW7983593.1 hypothetical protein [Acidobacteriota bacterium]
MGEIVFTGVSPRSLGDLLKGYGIMAILGELYPDALFWWDEAYHLVMKMPDIQKESIQERLRDGLLEWAQKVSREFKPRRSQKCGRNLPCPYHGMSGKRGNQETCQESSFLIRTPAFHDALEPELALFARAVAVPPFQPPPTRPSTPQEKPQLQPHPLFPSYGQEGSGNYFSQLDKATKAAQEAEADLAWSLLPRGRRP